MWHLDYEEDELEKSISPTSAALVSEKQASKPASHNILTDLERARIDHPDFDRAISIIEQEGGEVVCFKKATP